MDQKSLKKSIFSAIKKISKRIHGGGIRKTDDFFLFCLSVRKKSGLCSGSSSNKGVPSDGSDQIKKHLINEFIDFLNREIDSRFKCGSKLVVTISIGIEEKEEIFIQKLES